MTPTPPSTTSSSAGPHSPDAQYRIVRKRNRVPLSCAPCRHRKLKCNRAHPCENCVKRGDSASCNYAAPGVRKRNQSSHGTSSSDEMQNRIDRLEGLVLSLMTNGAQSGGPLAATAALSSSDSLISPQNTNDAEDDEMIKEESEGDESEVEHVTSSFGMMKVNAENSMYVGGSHWATILQDISEVKNYFIEHKKQFEDQMKTLAASSGEQDNKGPAFVFGTVPAPPVEELIFALPPKSTSDQLVSRYFNSYDPAVHILHGPTFRKEYEAHLANPSKTPIIWVGLLFAIMNIALQSYDRAGDEPPEYQGRAMQVANIYRKKTAECLVAADFSKPTSTMLETLIMNFQGDTNKNKNVEFGDWVFIGMIVRLAMRMGYHRDPAPFNSSLTPFQGEMRRRVWTFLHMADLLFSFQLGLPSMIRSSDCDTALPSNLYDDEFGDGIAQLPPSRPMTEATPVSYMITKAQFALTFGLIVEQTSALSPRSYEDVMRLDNKLRETRATMPLHLRFRSMEESMMDPANLIMQRFNLDLLYHKGQCVLHRKYLARARSNPRYAHSRRTCIDASMELLSHQATLHRESLPNGRLRSVKWFISSLTAHDFLLAAFLICLDLNDGSEAQATGQDSAELYHWGIDRQSEMVKALETSKAIWTELRDQSIEAYKATELLNVMLTKLKKTHPTNTNTLPNQVIPPTGPLPAGTGASSASVESLFAQGATRPEHSAAMTLEMMSGGGMTPNSSTMPDKIFNSPQGNSSGGNSNSLSADPTGLMPSSAVDGSGTQMLDAGASPFSTFGSAFGMMDMPSNLDWDAWDSYVNNPAEQLWPTNMDLGTPAPVPLPDGESARPATQQPPPPQQQSQGGSFDNGGGGVFMGVSTPPNNNM